MVSAGNTLGSLKTRGIRVATGPSMVVPLSPLSWEGGNVFGAPKASIGLSKSSPAGLLPTSVRCLCAPGYSLALG